MDKKESVILGRTKEILTLIQFNFLHLLFFEAIYTVAGTMIIYPGVFFLFNKIMTLLGFPYLSGSNFSQAMTNPLCLVTLLCFAFFVAFFGLLEFTTLILLFNESHFRRKVQLIPLCKEGFKRAIKIVKAKNFPFVIFILIIIPLTEFSLSSNFISEISIPEFIMSYITASPLYSTGFTALSLLLFLLSVIWIFSFHYFTLESRHFFQAIKKSRVLIKGHFWKTIFFVIFFNILILMLLVIAVIVLEIIAFFILGQLLNHPLALAIFIAAFGFLVSGLFTIFQLLTTSLNLAVVSELYYAYSASANIMVNPEPLAKDRYKIKVKQKTIAIIGMITVLLFIAINSFAIFNTFSETFNDQFLTGPQITAHRGGSNLAPENTLAALQKAIDEGADYAEIDVAQTRDGIIVVSHDNNIKRISGQDLNIWSSNYADIKDLDIGSWFDPQFKNERIPTLAEAIELCQGKILLNIELKPTGHEASLVESTVAIIKQHDFSDQCVLASLDYPTLEKVGSVDPDQKRAYITALAIGDIQKLPVDIYSIESSFVTPEIVTAIHRENKEVLAWTVDSQESTEKMVK
ncbi:MAG: hypothetical protein CVU92_10425, partial [Firmicutes bacterium HGW-Firmicutes-17]